MQTNLVIARKNNIARANFEHGGGYVFNGTWIEPHDANREDLEGVRAAFIRFNRRAKRRRKLLEIAEILTAISVGFLLNAIVQIAFR
jgi:hypothetical protein